MTEHGGLLHNMSAPPKTVVTYGGLRGARSRAFPQGLHSLPLPGVAVRFFLPRLQFRWSKKNTGDFSIYELLTEFFCMFQTCISVFTRIG